MEMGKKLFLFVVAFMLLATLNHLLLLKQIIQHLVVLLIQIFINDDLKLGICGGIGYKTNPLIVPSPIIGHQVKPTIQTTLLSIFLQIIIGKFVLNTFFGVFIFPIFTPPSEL